MIDGTPYDMRIKMDALHFDGHASTFYQSLVQSTYGGNLNISWDSYKMLLKDRFEDVLDDPIAELKQLQETSGIVDYHEKFELIKTRVNLSEEYLVSAYLAGLRIDTQMHVRMFQPHSVRQCLLLGRLYERAHPRNTVSSNWSTVKNSYSTNQNKSMVQYKREGDNKIGEQKVTNSVKNQCDDSKKILV